MGWHRRMAWRFTGGEVAVDIIDIRDGTVPLDASSAEVGQTDAC